MVFLGEQRWGGRRSANVSALVFAADLWRTFFFVLTSKDTCILNSTDRCLVLSPSMRVVQLPCAEQG